MTRICVLASGGGTNFQSIIDASLSGLLNDARIALLFTDKEGAGAVARAKKNSIPVIVQTKEGFKDREEYDASLVKILKEHSIDLVVLAGFMRLLSPTLIRAFPEKILNIHPALLPAFPGLNVQKKALEYGARFSGCTVHFVDEGVDTGPIVIQAIVPVLQNDSPETLGKRILAEEHRIYPEAIRLYSEGKLKIEGRRVIIKDLAEDDIEAGQVIRNPKVRGRSD